MSFFRRLLAVTTVATLYLPTHSLASHTPTPLETMLEKATPAVVNIQVLKSSHAEDTRKYHANASHLAVGSGVIIDAKNGYIVTNEHITERAKSIVVTLKDHRRFFGQLVGATKDYDIALIQIPAKNLHALRFGNSRRLKVGETVIAIGSPYGLAETVTKGVVSALHRNDPRIESQQSFIQTDAPINPGNSGGALINEHGEFIGMNTAIITDGSGNVGIGFAIPTQLIQPIVTQLMAHQKIRASVLGVIVQNITPVLAQALQSRAKNGVIISKVTIDSAADEAGLKAGDIITAVNDEAIFSVNQLRTIMGYTAPSSKLSITIMRDNHNKPFYVTTHDANKTAGASSTMPLLSGVRLQSISTIEPDNSQLNGAMVLSVATESQAALSGLAPGDVIVQANRAPTTDSKHLSTIAKSAKQHLLLRIIRGSKPLFLVIEARQGH